MTNYSRLSHAVENIASIVAFAQRAISKFVSSLQCQKFLMILQRHYLGANEVCTTFEASENPKSEGELSYQKVIFFFIFTP